jgi:hypothetical protein
MQVAAASREGYNTGMEAVWLILAAIGGGVLLLTFVADTFEVDLPGTDAGLPAEALAGFLAATGLIGFLLTTTGAAAAVTVPVAVGAGVGTGAAALALVRFLVRSPTDPTPTQADFVGAIARVVTPIAKGELGEVIVTRHGQPWKVAAELADGDDGPVPSGAQVVVVASPSSTRVVVTPADL